MVKIYTKQETKAFVKIIIVTYFWPKFRFFDQNLVFFSTKISFLTKFHFLTNILTKIQIFRLYEVWDYTAFVKIIIATYPNTTAKSITDSKRKKHIFIFPPFFPIFFSSYFPKSQTHQQVISFRLPNGSTGKNSIWTLIPKIPICYTFRPLM